MNVNPIIIPVAGGKGGVGKSLITTNLALSFAKLGYKTIVADLDLGGSNLHSYLGLSNQHPGVGDFLYEKGSHLDQFLVTTNLPNLSFLAGDGLSPFLANMGYFQKIRLMKEIRKLSADFVFLDLSAGSTFNTLDFFNMSQDGLIVTTPDYSSIMNFMVFLKNLSLRTVIQEVKSDYKAKTFVDEAKKITMRDKDATIDKLIAGIAKVSPGAADKAVKRLKDIKPRLIVNMTRDSEELDFLQKVIESVSKRLSINIEYLGSILEDVTIYPKPRWSPPAPATSTGGVFSQEVALIAKRFSDELKFGS